MNDGPRNIPNCLRGWPETNAKLRRSIDFKLASAREFVLADVSAQQQETMTADQLAEPEVDVVAGERKCCDGR